ncbi:MAG TPA: PAS domain-containing sensor histidine kinase [Ramlibacter sp.]
MTPQARELLDLALHTQRDYALVLLDADGIVVGWLGGAERIFGYTADEMLGHQVSVLFAPEDVARKLDVHELEVARRNSDSQDDRWHVRKDGTRIWVTGTVTALRDEGGLRGYIKIMRDRTDERIGAENRANHVDAADVALDRTHRFLQTLGHELRNPLAPIKNAAYIARRGSNDPRVQKAADTIVAQVGVLERLTSDLMDVSRLQHRKLDLQLSEFDIRALLEDEAAGQRLPATAKDIRLDAVLPAHPLPLVADASRVRQAVSNLLVNAIKYTPAGGTVWLKATQEAQDIVIRVQDTGIGIAPHVLPRIFELFTQESRASDLVPGGLGVGLAIVAQIAELHGGIAQARSAGTGKGSEFTLRLPRGGPQSAGSMGAQA